MICSIQKSLFEFLNSQKKKVKIDEQEYLN